MCIRNKNISDPMTYIVHSDISGKDFFSQPVDCCYVLPPTVSMSGGMDNTTHPDSLSTKKTNKTSNKKLITWYQNERNFEGFTDFQKKRTLGFLDFCFFLASQDALEVMRVSHLLSHSLTESLTY